MGLLNQIWWLLGFLMAAPLLMAGAENVLANRFALGVLLLILGGLILFLPEYLRWRLLGGPSLFERVPLIGGRTDQADS